MKISEALIKQGCIDESIQFEAHERVPFFIVSADSVFLENEDVTLNVVENYYTEDISGVIYAKMDSSHKNIDGTFSGAEPTYNSDMSTARQKLWAEQFELVTAEKMKELRYLNSLTPQEYRDEMRGRLEKESKPGHFAFDCEVNGQVLSYDIEDSDRIDVIGQLVMGATEVEIHDVKRIKDICTAEEAGIIMGTLAAVTRNYKYPYDAKIKALYKLPEGFTKEDVDVIVNG